MKLLLNLIICLFSVTTYADVIEKLKLEDALKNRIEQGLQLYDSSAKVNVSVGLKKYTYHPGTSFDDSFELNPESLEESDILSIKVQIFSNQKEITPEISNAINNLIPIRKKNLSVIFTHVPKVELPKPKQVEPQDLNNLTNQFIDQFSKLFVGISAISVLCLLLLALYVNNKNLREFKNQFSNLTNTISEKGGLGSAGIGREESFDSSASVGLNAAGAISSLDLPWDGFLEILSDCYWCQEDGYAHWLWQKTPPDIKQRVLQSLGYFKDYASHFVTLPPVEKSEHLHPYYLTPLKLSLISQDDLSKYLKKSPGLWNALGPIRQKNLNVPIKEKLFLISNSNFEAKSIDFKSSTTFRKLESISAFGELSMSDESSIFKDPKLVPENLRKHVRTLAWLCHKDDNYIQGVLGQFDARELASAWIGSSEILEKLEKNLPEKKLKLVKTYVSQVRPSKNSRCYKALVEAGIANNAA